MSVLLSEKILQMFLIILAGFILTKSHVIRSEDGEPLSKIILFLIVPACIISTFRISLTREILCNMGFSAAASVGVMLLAVAAPSAASVVQFALLYGEDRKQAGAINVVSTLLCIITIPAMTELYLHMAG